MKALHMIGFILVIIGGLNWGLIGLSWLTGSATEWNVVHMIFSAVGMGMQLEGIVYILVGLSAVWLLIDHKKTCRMCAPN